MSDITTAFSSTFVFAFKRCDDDYKVADASPDETR